LLERHQGRSARSGNAWLSLREVQGDSQGGGVQVIASDDYDEAIDAMVNAAIDCAEAKDN
jgi:hypothetical protein